MPKMLVTGHLGFIGRNLYNELNGMGHEVIGLEKDILNEKYWRHEMYKYLNNEKPDAVFHVGACSDTQNKDLLYMMKLNAQSTFIIANWCRRFNVPIIYSSSASVMGSKGNPETIYACSKYLGETSVSELGGVSLRYFNVYGEGEEHKGSMASVAYQAYMANWDGRRFKLFSGKPMRDFVYVKDVVSANIHAYNNFYRFSGGIYDVGTTMARHFEDVLRIMNIPFDYHTIDEIPQNYQHYTEASKTGLMSGWNAKYNLEDGLSSYIQYLNEKYEHN